MLSEAERLHIIDLVAPSIKSETDRALLLAAAEVVGVGPVPKQLSDARLAELLSVIEGVLPRPPKMMGHYASQWLWALAAHHEPARAKLLELFGSLNATGRVRIIQNFAICRTDYPPRIPTQIHLLRQALKDKSVKVRFFSAERAGASTFLELLTDVDAAAKVETDSRVVESLRVARDFLVQGYTLDLERPRDGFRWVLVKMGDGGVAGANFPENVIKEVGLAEVVRRFRIRCRAFHSIPGGDFDPIPEDHPQASDGQWPVSSDKPAEAKPVEPAAVPDTPDSTSWLESLVRRWGPFRQHLEAKLGKKDDKVPPTPESTTTPAKRDAGAT